MKRLLIVAALFVAPCPAQTAATVKDLKYPPLGSIQLPHVDSVTLPNGMKLYLLEDHELPLVSGMALVRTGNLFDPPDRVGLAGLTGMLIRAGGTRAKTAEQLDEQLDTIAASVESSIGETSGTVSFSALKENAGEVLTVFKDILTSPEFREDKIGVARSQVRSAISHRNDDARVVAERQFIDTVYGKDTPYGWDQEYATIERIHREDLQAFYQRYFFPANVMLAIQGDFDTGAMKADIEKLFSDWTVKQPPVPEFPKVAPPPPGGVWLAAKQDALQTFFAIGQPSGELKDPDYPALEIMADILGGGSGSRLFQRLRATMAVAYTIGATWGAQYDHPGLFQISGSAKSLSMVETVEAIREEVARIRTAEVTDQELRSAKEIALNRLAFAFDTKAKMLNRILAVEYFGYPADFVQQYQRALAAVTRADVLRVAKAHLDPAAFTIMLVGNPRDFGQPLDKLGSPPKTIDLTIPPPKPEAAQPDTTSLDAGKRLLQRVQQAVGSAARLAAVRDSTVLSTFQLAASAGGALVKVTDRWIAPSILRQESAMPAGKMIACWDGKDGWFSTGQSVAPLTLAQLKQLQGDLFRWYIPFLLSDRMDGRKVNAVDETTLEITDQGGQMARLVVDPATGLPSKTLYQVARPQGPPIWTEEDYAGFRDAGGIQMPYRITILEDGKKFADVTVTDYRFNTGLKVEELQKRP